MLPRPVPARGTSIKDWHRADGGRGRREKTRDDSKRHRAFLLRGDSDYFDHGLRGACIQVRHREADVLRAVYRAA